MKINYRKEIRMKTLAIAGTFDSSIFRVLQKN